MAKLHVSAPTFTIEALVSGKDLKLCVSSDGAVDNAYAARALGISISKSERKGSWRLLACPKEPASVRLLRAELPATVRAAKAVYLNGYQSWTDSIEHGPWDTMVGLENVPRRIIDNYALDAPGDYHFTRYNLFPGEMHGFGYGYLRSGDETVLVGSLNEDTGFTLVRSSSLRNLIILEKEPPARELPMGAATELMGFAIVEGGLSNCVAAWLELAGRRAAPAPAIAGYSSWYRHYNDITQDKMLHDLEGMEQRFSALELGPVKPVFQVDDGWCKVGDWMRPLPDRFPDMAALASTIADKGFTPGLWLGPFMIERESKLFGEHPDWFLQKADGTPIYSKMSWSGACVLDTRVPAARDYLRDCLRMVTEDWGFKLLKLDFLFGACMERRDGMNRGELMADAIDLMRGAVADDVVFDLCGVPISSALGKTEYCRIGCDVGLDWDDSLRMRLLHRERVSTKWSLANTYGRAHLDGLAFRNDPDVYFLRDDVALSDKRKEKLLQADARLGGAFLTSDDMGAWGPDEQAAFKAAFELFKAKEA